MTFYDVLDFLIFAFDWFVLALVPIGFILALVYASKAKTKYRKKREDDIRSNAEQWGNGRCDEVVRRQVSIGMTEEMVISSWGNPNNIDRRKSTTKYDQKRWVYGVPRQGSGANYVTIRNGVVHEMMQNRAPRVSEPNYTLGALGIWIVSLMVLGTLDLFLVFGLAPRLLAAPSSSTEQNTPNTQVEKSTLYVCGIDRCQGSGEYGKLIFPTNINIWNNPDPDRNGVHHRASHGDEVVIVDQRRVSEGSGGMWYKLEGGGWTNNLWLTDRICTIGNIQEYSLDDC